MTENEMRELDDWIAVNFMGWARVDLGSPNAPVWKEEHEDKLSDFHTWETTSFGEAFQPSTLPAAFAQVKREIERIGWEWECKYYSLDKCFQFDIWDLRSSRVVHKAQAVAESEELAGCLAVKEALEKESGG